MLSRNQLYFILDKQNILLQENPCTKRKKQHPNVYGNEEKTATFNVFFFSHADPVKTNRRSVENAGNSVASTSNIARFRLSHGITRHSLSFVRKQFAVVSSMPFIRL